MHFHESLRVIVDFLIKPGSLLLAIDFLHVSRRPAVQTRHFQKDFLNPCLPKCREWCRKAR